MSEASEDLLDCLIKADPKYSEGCHEQGSKEGHHRHSIEDGLCRRAKPFRSVRQEPSLPSRLSALRHIPAVSPASTGHA